MRWIWGTSGLTFAPAHSLGFTLSLAFPHAVLSMEPGGGRALPASEHYAIMLGSRSTASLCARWVSVLTQAVHPLLPQLPRQALLGTLNTVVS